VDESGYHHTTMLSCFKFRTIGSVAIVGYRCRLLILKEPDPACSDEDRCVVTAQGHTVLVQRQRRSLATVADTGMRVVCGFDR
jgi:hypothetical protein